MTSITNLDLFKGNRIRFATFHEDDAAIAARWTESYDYMQRMDTEFAVPETVQSNQRDDKGGKGANSVHFRLRTIEDDKLIGFVVVHSIEWNNRMGVLSIGIGEPEYQSKGYGTEALQMMLRYAFWELNLDRVGLDVIEYNERAVCAYEKVGFQHEGRMRQAVMRGGKKYDRLIMGILRDEWEAMHADHDDNE